MSVAESTSVSDKRALIKSCASKFAKAMKALELALIGTDDGKISQLRREVLDSWNVYEKELSDIDVFDQEQQTQLQRSCRQSLQELDLILEQVSQRIGAIDETLSLTRSQSRHSAAPSERKRQRAELKLAHIRRRQDLERRQQDLEFQQAEIRREMEKIAVENDLARIEIEDDSGSSSSNSVASNNVILPEMRQSAREKTEAYVRSIPDVTPTLGQPELNVVAASNPKPSDNDLFNGFMAMTSSVQESLNLPKPELLTFSGNPADYCKFIKNFETNIEMRLKDNRLKLSYLVQFCNGDARRSIEDCVVLPSDEGYVRAKQILQGRYGKPHLVARSHVERLIDGSPVKPKDVQGLMNLSLDMEKCQITLSQIGFVSDINNTENLKKIVRRLPMHIRSKWAERASS
ncbi:uncharacterized protein LOC123564751 [Mercenaria mercenaria]|uniref:uncharacterized protein LOC123564751 n=1 Tax=Mercenaria mercenaria TaxID=6596 RepID=UPI00234EB7E7|nr:uncharacterized protein LOC123564751 [Mercenaria mercenaria]